MASGDRSDLLCPACKSRLPVSLCLAEQHSFRCLRCSSEISVEVFPALFREVESGKSADELLDVSDASCFYHEGKRAAIVCESCGRFLCSLCHIRVSGSDVCPSCVKTGRSKGKLKTVVNSHKYHDTMMMTAAFYALLVCILGLMTVKFPASSVTILSISGLISLLVIAGTIKYWKKPMSVLPRSKVRFVFAIFFALPQLIAWIGMICYVMAK